VVTKLDRLARSLPDARSIADELTSRHDKLRLFVHPIVLGDSMARLLPPDQPQTKLELLMAHSCA
jgi:DNA invertase Pin-like site-specific DNA recombinase